MKKIFINNLWIMLVIILMFIPCSNVSGQGGNSDGYGSYDKMGQDPDEILEYGRRMMKENIK